MSSADPGAPRAPVENAAGPQPRAVASEAVRTEAVEIEVDRPDVMIPLADITVTADRLRELDESWAAAIGASFEDKGQDTAIIVRPWPHGATPYRLVAGMHRHAGAGMIGWSMIRATVRDLDDHEARLVEIDENLMRRELHVLDRAIFLAERKRLYEARNPAAKNGGDRRSTSSQTLRTGVLPPRFTEDAAAKTGFSERAIQLAIQLATNLDEDVIRLIRGLPIADNQAALMSLSREDPRKQRTLAAQFRDGRAKTIAQAAVLAGFEEAPTEENPQMGYLAQLHTAWGKANLGTRMAFLKDVDAAFRTLIEDEAKPSAEPSAAGRRPAKGTR